MILRWIQGIARVISAASAFIKQKLLNIALSRVSPEMVPRSGEEGAAVNCFTTRVYLGEGKSIIVVSADGDNLNCLELDQDGRYRVETTHPFKSLLNYRFEFTHHHGLTTTIFSGWIDFALGQIFRFPYLKAWFIFKKTDLLQFIYNRKKLVTKQRIDLLRTILEAELTGIDHLDSLTVMSLMNGDMWYFHPHGRKTLFQVEFYMDALAQTKHLKKMGSNYQITGHGIEAIERYEEDERKHSENIGNQRRMFWLTVFIALLTIVQAGLVKLPPVLDLSKAAGGPPPSLVKKDC